MTDNTVRQRYADVIVDITHERLDQIYQYKIPEKLRDSISPGTCVEIPFGKGNRRIRGYVIAVEAEARMADEQLKELTGLSEKGMDVASNLIRLASWIRMTYGCTMIQALRTVLPVRDRIQKKTPVLLKLCADQERIAGYLEDEKRKHHTAKVRLAEELQRSGIISHQDAVKKLRISAQVIRSLERDGILTTCSGGVEEHLPPDPSGAEPQQIPEMTKEQKAAAARILDCWQKTPDRPVLIEGVTGSGKTLVYMELAEHVIREGREVIVLIPEIALSWQIVRRFRSRFGDIVAVLHSRMGKGERYEQLDRVKRGEAKIMIGPRSALFTPFSNPGLIIIDEEQEQSYRSEETPRYDARETAIARASFEHAHVVMGSATPSLDSYARAEDGRYLLVTLPERYGSAGMPKVSIADMRAELRSGNRSMISRPLQEMIRDRLAKREQIMLFLNKRGLAGFISCRSCGNVIKCPHCDVSLTAHNNGKLICHYCGYQTGRIAACPSCGSPHIYGFRAGTQKVEQTVHQLFPEARILRMDADTTRGKEGHGRILRAFAAHEADILIGTQMIVKGHDFPDVTLVGVLLADLSLYASDYRAAERTFQLLVQAVGRAGRGSREGAAVIQSYAPDHYSIQTAAAQDYRTFYREEIAARKMMHYPPAGGLLTVHVSCRNEEKLNLAAGYIRQYLVRIRTGRQVVIIGPAPEAVSKVQEYYRQVITLKAADDADLIRMRRQLEHYIEINSGFRDVRIQYDLNK